VDTQRSKGRLRRFVTPTREATPRDEKSGNPISWTASERVAVLLNSNRTLQQLSPGICSQSLTLNDGELVELSDGSVRSDRFDLWRVIAAQMGLIRRSPNAREDLP
jgi:hypothetical protein